MGFIIILAVVIALNLSLNKYREADFSTMSKTVFNNMIILVIVAGSLLALYSAAMIINPDFSFSFSLDIK